jgi:hypothetical protein
VSWDGLKRHAVGEIGENGWGQRRLEKRDNRGKLRPDHYELETVDVHVSWVFVMEVKSVTHVIQPHDIKPETKWFAIGTASDLTRIANADGLPSIGTGLGARYPTVIGKDELLRHMRSAMSRLCPEFGGVVLKPNSPGGNRASTHSRRCYGRFLLPREIFGGQLHGLPITKRRGLAGENQGGRICPASWRIFGRGVIVSLHFEC